MVPRVTALARFKPVLSSGRAPYMKETRKCLKIEYVKRKKISVVK
jgi:hypothetical protein